MSDRRSKLPEVSAESLRDKVVAALKEAFFAGTLRPGDTIVERRIASEMRVGTPAIREALVTLQEQGFVRRVANTATYVRKFTIDEVDQLYRLRIEFESLAFSWARQRVTGTDLDKLDETVARMATAAVNREIREFYELDLEFHRQCWSLCGNEFLYHALNTLVTPLFAFVLSASEATVSAEIAREHYNLVNALRRLDEPDFSKTVRSILGGFALSGVKSMIQQ